MNAVEIENLTHAFANRVAVDALTVSIPEETVFGFLGPRGAGKTTTLGMLTTLIAPTSGTARVTGYVVGREDQAIQQAVGILTGTPQLYANLSIRQNLNFFARLYDLDSTQTTTQVNHYLHLLGLWEQRNTQAAAFSKGIYQSLAIACLLLRKPRVLFLDEPTRGLNPESVQVVHAFINKLREEGRTIVMTTDSLSEVEEVCDLVGIIHTRLLHVDTPIGLRKTSFVNSWYAESS